MGAVVGVLPFPVAPMLATAVRLLPEPGSARGGVWYEPKFDGYRALVFVDEGGVRVQSRRGADLTASFPDIAAAARQLTPRTVLDGELVIWTHGVPDFPALQRRLAHRRDARDLAAAEPAHLLLFDLLAFDGVDLRQAPFRSRRDQLERLSANISPPLQLVPGTSDINQARRWLEDYSRVEVGIEGLVIKGLDMPYQAGQRGWLKYKLHDTVEAVVGAVIGTPERAERLVLGRYDAAGRLRIVGRHTRCAPHSAWSCVSTCSPQSSTSGPLRSPQAAWATGEAVTSSPSIGSSPAWWWRCSPIGPWSTDAGDISPGTSEFAPTSIPPRLVPDLTGRCRAFETCA